MTIIWINWWIILVYINSKYMNTQESCMIDYINNDYPNWCLYKYSYNLMDKWYSWFHVDRCWLWDPNTLIWYINKCEVKMIDYNYKYIGYANQVYCKYVLLFEKWKLW